MHTQQKNLSTNSLARKRHGKMIGAFCRMARLSMIVGVPAFLIAIIYFIFISNFFAIQTIDIHAPQSVNIEPLRSALYNHLDTTQYFFIQQRNIFAYNENEAKNIISKMLLTSHVSLKKKYPHAISIEIEGKEFELLWYSNGSVWRVGGDGSIIGDADQSTLASLPLHLLRKRYGPHVVSVADGIQKKASIPPLIVDAQQQHAVHGSSVIDATVLDQLLFLRQKSKDAGFTMAYALYLRDTPSITIVSTEGWEAYLLLDSTLDGQFTSLSTLLTHSIKKNRSRLKYIDVRFDNRAYYTLL